MRIVRSGNNLRLVLSFRDMVKHLTNDKGRKELQRGVVDAGRKTKTQVQRAVTKQMALLPGNYQGYVVKNTRGISVPTRLSFEIYSYKGGERAEKYKGLRALKAGGRAARKLNSGRVKLDAGYVRSNVWNNPRIFKRSFSTNNGFFAMRPAREGLSKGTPKAFFTFGSKPGQPRSADGKFASSGVRYGKVRRLHGPGLNKEITQDLSLATFLKVGPPLLERAVSKRLEKLMRF